MLGTDAVYSSDGPRRRGPSSPERSSPCGRPVTAHGRTTYVTHAPTALAGDARPASDGATVPAHGKGRGDDDDADAPRHGDENMGGRVGAAQREVAHGGDDRRDGLVAGEPLQPSRERRHRTER